MQTLTGLTDFAAVNVPHCLGAKAVALTFPTGFKFSYSGDCRPSKHFVDIGKDSTVLLHEATFDDELQGDAIAKQHSTTSEAVGIGIAMRARRIILTHFSQRYQKIPVISTMQGKALDLELEEVATSQDIAETVDVSDGFSHGIIASATTAERPLSAMVEDEELEDLLPLSTSPSPPPTTKVERAEAIPQPLSTMVEDEEVQKLLPMTNLPSPPTNKVGPIKVTPQKDLKVAVAYDYMRVKVKAIAILEKFTPVFMQLYEGQDGAPIQPKKDGTTIKKGAKKTKV